MTTKANDLAKKRAVLIMAIAILEPDLTNAGELDLETLLEVLEDVTGARAT